MFVPGAVAKNCQMEVTMELIRQLLMRRPPVLGLGGLTSVPGALEGFTYEYGVWNFTFDK
eukprot:scaffold65216_cov53-Cyclotella_meneghiniana.AAC.1